MSLLEILIVLVVVGVVLWAITRFVPMEANVKTLLNVVVILVLLLYLLKGLGFLDFLGRVRL